MLSTWWYSTDGVYVGPHSAVLDSFIMVNDDAVKPMVSGVLVDGCTIWQGDNGWSVMMGWNTGDDESGMTVQNVHVIHVGYGNMETCLSSDFMLAY